MPTLYDSLISGNGYKVRLVLAQLGIGRDPGEAEPIAQRVDVEHGAAFDDRHAATRRDIGDCGSSAFDVFGGVERRRGIDEIDHVVAHALPLLRAGLVGGDVQALVHLARVSNHDLAAELQRKLIRNRGLADAGGSDDDWNADRFQ